jgi:MFS family permease
MEKLFECSTIVLLTLHAAATALPMTLISVIANDFIAQQQEQAMLVNYDFYNNSTISMSQEQLYSSTAAAATSLSSYFASRAPAAAVLGTSLGKLLNGPKVDLVGARQTSVIYAILLLAAFVLLAFCKCLDMVLYACFLLEFAYSVQWPCVVVTLATHARWSTSGMYEGGIFVTSPRRSWVC